MNKSIFKISEPALLNFFETLRPVCRNTGRNTEPSFGDENSLIAVSSLKRKPRNCNFLCIDIGGSRTKVCIKSTPYGAFEEKWLELLDTDNKDLRISAAGKGLALMFTELGKRVRLEIDGRNLPDHFDGVAPVWSNKIRCFSLSGTARGIGAKVFGSKDGQAYRKGEWWNSDIKDGDDISSYLQKGLHSAGIHFGILIISNDTIFTARALPSACAGVVASTGANSTIVPVDHNQFFNSECGGKVLIPGQLLNLREVAAVLPGSNSAVKMEDLATGKGLPRIFHLLLRELTACGHPQLRDLDSFLSEAAVSSRDLEDMLSEKSVGRLAEKVSLQPADRALLLSTLEQLVFNAGGICALFIFISVANQLKPGAELPVALDSSQARFMPGYRQALDHFLSFLNSAFSVRVSYQLLQPAGNISVPLQGAAAALEDFATD